MHAVCGEGRGTYGRPAPGRFVPVRAGGVVHGKDDLGHERLLACQVDVEGIDDADYYDGGDEEEGMRDIVWQTVPIALREPVP